MEEGRSDRGGLGIAGRLHCFYVAEEDAPVKAKEKPRLPHDEVMWIISQQRMEEMDTGSVEDERLKDLLDRESLFEFIDWVRDEYQSKSFVEVTEEYLAERAEVDAWAGAEWDRIMAKLADSDDEDDDLDTTIEMEVED
uniref:Uncharacterized protein n=1 Tax=Oryza punctata TaxID=4537 RepID=A0A0E0LLY0_ORYPU